MTLCGGIAGFLKCYIVMLTLRVYLTWFPNINFYQQPFAIFRSNEQTPI